MTSMKTLAALAPVALGLGLAGAGALASGPEPVGAPSCEIRAVQHGAMVLLDGVVHGRDGDRGSYRLGVVKSGGGGGIDIDQNGEFAIGADDEVIVASVTIASAGGYRAAFEVTAHGSARTCTDTFEGAL